MNISVRIFIDYQDLMYFAEGRDLSRRQARYLDMLSEFNIKIVYRPGSQNSKADALIRLPGFKPSHLEDKRLLQQRQTILTPDRIDDYDTVVAAIDDPLFHRVAEGNKNDEDLSEIRQAIADGKEKLHGISLSKCSVDNGILYHKERLWVSTSILIDVIQEAHDQPTCDHPGVARINNLIRREYYWRGMRNTIAQYVTNCYTCQRAKAPRNKDHGLLQSLPIPEKRWQDLSMDFITGLPLSSGHNAICVIVDRLTKERHYIAYTASDDGTSVDAVIDIMISWVFRLHGLPASIVSDRGP